ncbi:MAG: hypothetical protein ACRCST_17565 [Turicibacter sp.]
MGKLNESKVLNFYLDEVMQDKISFLKNRTGYKEPICDLILELSAERSMNKQIIIAKKLWKCLFEAALTYIDDDKRGYDKLFKFFDEYVSFEELIFASDSFYRDHTLHCLWVYFLGEYMKSNEQFKTIYVALADESKKYGTMAMDLKSLNMPDVFEEMIEMLELYTEMDKYHQSIQCLTALTHDLGYPIKKIEKINKCIKSIIPYFSIKDFNEFSFNYSTIDQAYIERFIELLSWSFKAQIKSVDEFEGMFKQVFECDTQGNLIGFNKEAILSLTPLELTVLKKSLTMEFYVIKEQSNELTYSNDFEEYKHGIMSAFLLMKNIKCFNGMSLSYYLDGKVGKFNKSIVNVLAKIDILTAITNHTSEGYRISNIDSTSAFLTFIDELEEFSRISRANQNREYISEYCQSDIYVCEGCLHIDFIFSNTEIDNLDPERAFKGRCRRFLSLFDIPNLASHLQIKLRCIGQLPHDQNIYLLELKRKYASISINNLQVDIPNYLKSSEFYTTSEYEQL